MPPSLLASQLDTLEPLAPEEPGFVVETTHSPVDVADQVLQRLADDDTAPAMRRVEDSRADYR